MSIDRNGTIWNEPFTHQPKRVVTSDRERLLRLLNEWIGRGWVDPKDPRLTTGDDWDAQFGPYQALEGVLVVPTVGGVRRGMVKQVIGYGLKHLANEGVLLMSADSYELVAANQRINEAQDDEEVIG